MGFFDVVFHLVNFVLPALAMALLLPSLARLLWWRRLAKVSWALMAKRVAITSLAVLLGGLLLLGRDGAMLTYAALVLGSALAVWWTAFKGRV
jgi:hypothetical protein